jgi:hypothetical protein
MVKMRTLALCVGLMAIGIAPTVLAPTPAPAADQGPPTVADPAKEVATATLHAGLAAAAGDIKMVHTHLHHTINCLVGPDGAGYDAGEMNPCHGLGGGALPDTTDPTQKTVLESALKHAETGLGVDDLAAARKIAAETQNELKTVK